MKYFRCMCGKSQSWSTDGKPAACVVCSSCGSTLAAGPHDHDYPAEHKWTVLYDRKTGERNMEECVNCHQIRKIGASDV